MSKNKRLLKNTIIIGIGVMCTKAISFLMVPFYTMWLSPAQYGEYDLLVSYLSLFVPIITLQVEQAIFCWCLKGKNNLQYLYNGLLLTFINIVVVNILSYFLLSQNDVKLAFVLYFDSYAIFVLLAEYLRGNNKMKQYSLYNIVACFIEVCLSFLFVPILHLKIKGLIYAYAVAFLVVDIIIAIKENLFKNFRIIMLQKNILKEMLCYSLPLIPNSISWWITNVSDRTMIKFFIGSFYNGIYAVSCKIPTILSMVYSIFNLSWQQTAIMCYDDLDRDRYYKNIFNSLISFLFSSTMLILIAVPFFFNVFIKSDYYNAIYCVPFLLVGTIYLCLGQFLGGIMLAQKQTKNIGCTTTVAAVINVFINIILLKKYGLIVAGISTMISYMYFFFSRYCMITFIHNKMFITKIIMNTFAVAIISIILLSPIHVVFKILCDITIILYFFLINKTFFLKILFLLKQKI